MKVCNPICDFCVHYDFGADENGFYVNNGRCEHPAHPERKEPFDACVDFKCGVCCTPKKLAVFGRVPPTKPPTKE